MSVSGFDDRNVLGMLQAAYEATFAGSWASMLSLYNGASDRAVEEYGILGANSAMREWIGARQAQTLAKKSYEIRNRPYEGTLVVPQRELDRDKTGLLQARIGAFASDAGADHWETLLVDLINANGLCYDGQNFFDTDHLWGDSGTQLNELTVTQIPSANVGSATAPTPTEMANVLLETVAYMMAWKNDKGRPVNGQARDFTVVVATAPLFSATVQAIANNLLAGTVDNPLTGMKQGGFSFTPKLVPTLTSATDKVHVFRNKGPLAPFVLQEEQGIEINMLGRGSDFYFDNKAIKIGVDASRGAGYGLWEYAARVTLS